MFAPQDSGNRRKVFQKPNILRRKSKVKRGAPKTNESPENQHFIPAQIIENKPFSPANLNNRVIAEDPMLLYQESSISNINDSNLSPMSNNNLSKVLGASATVRIVAATSEFNESSGEVLAKISESCSNEKPKNSVFKYEFYMNQPTLFGQQANSIEEQSSLNIESFLVNTPNKQNDDSSIFITKKSETEEENEWCLNFMSDDSKDVITPNFYDETQKNICKVNTNPISFSNETNSPQEASKLEKDIIIQSCLTSRVIKYKCDIPNCNKSFWSEARLQKHKIIHSRQKTSNKPTIVECPIKKVGSDGVEQRCSALFPSKDDLVKHLNEDHVPEDTAYKCTHCGRHFWWATGLLKHTQTPCMRALACTWPGCSRVFRQPCRLREHARAHTGDRPYPCNYPNCGWAFRSASKLVRHSRRHTDERRHECAACGRAFLRREHLRDHAARYHAPAGDKRPCTHEGCEFTFTHMSSLYMHLKKYHQQSNKPAAPKKPPVPKKPAVTKNSPVPKKSPVPNKPAAVPKKSPVSMKPPPKKTPLPIKPAAPKKSPAPKKPRVPKKSPAPKKPRVPKKSVSPKKPKATKPKSKTGIEAANMLVMTLDGGSLIRYDIGGPNYATMADAIEAANATAMIMPEQELIDDDFTGMNEEANAEANEEVNEERRVDDTQIPPIFEYDLEGRCARTHCTWPLQRALAHEPAFAIEDDAQVEQSESSESNIYTVRSDLFLHGNVLINEDSEFIIRESSNRGEAEESSITGQLGGLDLIDSHPTIDLMQEELMYDGSVDESSFRVFMLNGEELS